MFTKLPPPPYDSMSLYKSMLLTTDEVYAVSLQQLGPKLGTAYKDYDRLSGSSKELVPATDITPSMDAALLNCYSRLKNKNVSPSNVRALLFLAVPKCPYCEVGEVAELDHVLPQSVWPEYTIHINNLVPVCGKCNGHKSTRSYLTSKWSYRHPYLGDAMTSKVLFAKAIIKGKNIRYEFSIACPDDMDSETYLAVKGAFKTFHLAKRFADQAVYSLSNRSFKLRQLYSDLGAGAVKEYLLSESETTSHARGINYWESVLLRDLAANADYCKFQHWS